MTSLWRSHSSIGIARLFGAIAGWWLKVAAWYLRPNQKAEEWNAQEKTLSQA
jgi:hypothetical protein